MATQTPQPEEHPLKGSTNEVMEKGREDMSSSIPGTCPSEASKRTNRRIKLLRTTQVYCSHIGVAVFSMATPQPEELPLIGSTNKVMEKGREDMSSSVPGTCPSEASKRTNRRIKLLRTIQVYCSYIGVAFIYHILGLTLLDLRDLTGTSTERVATLFLFRGLGGLTGTLVSGKLWDKMNYQILFFVPLFVTGIILCIIPWSTSFWATAVLHGIIGLFLSAPALGGNVMVVRIWKDKGAPFLQALHLLFPIAAFICPLFTEPFLTPRHSEQGHQHNISWKYSNMNNTSGGINVEQNNSYLSNLYADLEKPLGPAGAGRRNTFIEVPYSLIAAYVWLAGIPFFVQFLIKRDCRKHWEEETDDSSHAPGKASSKAKERLYWCLFFLKACALGALENSFSGLLFTYGVQALNWQTREAAYLWTVLSVCNAIGSLVGVFVSKYVSPAILLPIDYAVILSSLLGGAFGIHIHQAIPYVYTGLYGVGVATVFASSLSWAGSFVNLSGAFTSLFVVGYSVGLLGGPPLTAVLFETLSHAWYWYVLLVLTSIQILVYVVLSLMKRMSEAKYLDET